MTPHHLSQQVNDRSAESFRELGIAPYFDSNHGNRNMCLTIRDAELKFSQVIVQCRDFGIAFRHCSSRFPRKIEHHPQTPPGPQASPRLHPRLKSSWNYPLWCTAHPARPLNQIRLRQLAFAALADRRHAISPAATTPTFWCPRGVF